MQLFFSSSSCCIGCLVHSWDTDTLDDIVTNVPWSWSTMLLTKSLRFSTDVHARLYAALAAGEQRRVVQLSFTGCVNFSDMSDMDVGWCWYLAREMDETAWKWLEWWVNWRRVGKNQDWADMSKEALIFATHVFDMAKNNNLLAFNLPDFAKLFIENAIKARFHSRGTWHFFLVREFPASPFLKSWGLWGPQTFCPSLRFLLEL